MQNKTFNRVCVIVLDSAGIGATPDAADYGDEGAHTLGNILSVRGRLDTPNLYELGIGCIEDARLPAAPRPTAAYGRMYPLTRAKDTTSGHWELMGLAMEPPFETVTSFSESLLTEWLKRADLGDKWLGNLPASGTAIIDELGEEHMKTAAPIVYTSADSVFQVAAHEEVIPLAKLLKSCEIAREMLNKDPLLGRVIARPFIGSPGAFTRTKNRRDYAVPPTGRTLLDALEEKGMSTLGIGKIEDIFCNRGVTYVNHTTNNADGIQATIDALKTGGNELIFTNLVDFDMKYGHRNDPQGYGDALEYFDKKLPDIIAALKPTDLLILTADHGCDPTTKSTDHSREYVPVIAYGGNPANLGTRTSFTDLAATIAEALGFQEHEWNTGKSFYKEIAV